MEKIASPMHFLALSLDFWSHKVGKCDRTVSLCAFVNTFVLPFNQSPFFHVVPSLNFAHGEMRTRINVFSVQYTKPVVELSDVLSVLIFQRINST